MLFTCSSIIRADLNRDTNCFLLYLQKKESLQRYISQIYLCNGKTVSRFLYVSANMCIRLSKNICNVRFNYSTCLTIIITVTTMTNRPEEPDSWDVIDNLDIEAEHQSFLVNFSSCIIIFGVLWTKLEASANSKMGASTNWLEWSCHKASSWE